MNRYGVVLLVALILSASFAASAFYPPFRLLAMVAAGRSPQCSLSQAMACADHAKQLAAAHDRLVKAMVLLEHDAAGYDRWRTPMGTYWIPSGDRYVLPFNLAEEALKIYGTGPQDVHQGDIVLDCGANVGVFTREALTNGAAKVVMIEPAPENIEVLKRNFKDELAAGRVILYPKGVWDKDDVLTMHLDAKNSAADTFVIDRKESTSDIRLPLTTIDKLAGELALPKVDYIKMDIEGAEPNALRGARAVIAKFKPRISISAYHKPDHPALIPQIIKETRPDYTMECGPCSVADGKIRPDVLYFR
ncbi:MAG: FkbM family methyltransferase [Acidobacteria bacterium]|nr:FkbM family methyltransferase [Acidobacteriota bacterium]